MESPKSLILYNAPAIVHQDDFSPGKGNALQACVSALFHQPLQEVPNFVTLDCGYYKGIQDYLSGSQYKVLKIPYNEDVVKEDYKGKLCILRGKSPRGDFGHVVIAQIDNDGSMRMIHDPHPDTTFLDTLQEFGWFMIFLPIDKGNSNEEERG